MSGVVYAPASCCQANCPCVQPPASCPAPWPCPSAPPCLQPCPIPVTFQAAAVSNTVLTAGLDQTLAFTYALTANPAYTPFTSIFQAPTAGAYLFSANVLWSSPVANGTLSLSLVVGGQKALTSTSVAGAVVGTAQSAVLTGVLSLAAGQIVTVVANSSAASTVLGALPSPAITTWFAGTRA